MTFSVRVDQVGLHRVLLAIDMVLARGMEVELLQPVLASIQPNRAPFVIVDLNGVSVVHLMMTAGFVMKSDAREIGIDSADDIDRCLCLARLRDS